MISFDKIKDFRVLFVGDAIMDEYRYVTTVGKATKEPALSVVFDRNEIFRGGVWAAAKHLGSFCQQVDTMTGDKVMWNRRLVDPIYVRKLIVEHSVSDIEKPVAQDFDVGSYDVVIITDFGHGAMSKDLIARLSKEARFLAVNAQTNAVNYGFNMITKYRRADLVVIDELEARLAAHDNTSPIEDVILALGFKKIIVTMGTRGAIGFDGAFERAKALTDKVVDTMGAGDAFLAACAPFAAAGASMKDLLAIGNAAGAIKVGIVGHSASVTRDTLEAALG